MTQDFQPFAINISVNDGLPSKECYDVLEDEKRQLWFATDNGVVKYDGVSFVKPVKADPEIDNTIFDLRLDQKRNRIWFVTFKNMVGYISNDTMYSYQPINDILDTLSTSSGGLWSRRLRTFFNYENDWISLSTFSSGGIQYNLETGELNNKIVRDDLLYIEGKRSLHIIKNNKAFIPIIAVKKSAVRNGNVKELFLIDVDEVIDRVTFDKNVGIEVNYFGESPNGAIAFSFSNLVIIITPENKVIYYEMDYNVSMVRFDQNNDLWVGLMKNGVLHYDGCDVNKIKHHLFSQLTVTSMLNVSKDKYWFTTLEEGVKYIPNLKAINNDLWDYSLKEKGVLAMSTWGELLYFRTLKGELCRYDLKAKEDGVKTYSLDLFDKKMSTSLVAKNQDLLQTNLNSCWNNIRIGDQSVAVEKLNSNFILDSMMHFGDSGMKGLLGIYALFIEKGKDTIKIKTPNTRFTCQAEFKGQYYYGTKKSVLRLNLDKLQFEPIYSHGISQFCSTDSILYAIAGNRGIVYMRDSIVETGILKSEIIKQIQVLKDGSLICGSDKYYYRVEQILDKEKTRITVLGPSIGVNCLDASGIEIVEDQILLGAKSGLTILPIGSLIERKDSVFLNYLSINGEKMLDVNQKEFAYGVKNLTFHYLNPSRFGLHSPGLKLVVTSESHIDTMDMNGNKIEFNSLNHGAYSIQAIGLDVFGNYNLKSSVFSFEILGPFYLEWWFLMLASLSLGGLMWLIIKQKVEKARVQTYKDLRLSLVEQQVLRAQMNPHFISNMLTSLQTSILKEDKKVALTELSTYAKLIRNMLYNSAKEKVTISDEVSFLNQYIAIHVAQYSMPVEVEFEVEDEAVIGDKMIPVMVIQPFIENVFLHAFPKDVERKFKLSIHFSRVSENSVNVVIEDNGIGRREAKKRKSQKHESISMNNANERLKTYGKTYRSNYDINITDLSPGTRVDIQLPLFEQ